jgi:hypothetical protein
MILYDIATTVLWLSSNDWKYSNQQAPIFEAITAYCVQDYDWPIPAIIITPEPQPKEPLLPVWAQILMTMLYPVIILVGLIILYILVLGCRIFEWPFMTVASLLHIGPRRLGALILVSLFAIFAVFLTWTSLVDLLAQREKLHSLTGPVYQDNEWGFGQITALLTWIPVFQDLLLAIFSKLIFSGTGGPLNAADSLLSQVL